MTLKIPALDHIDCPKCGSGNTDKKVHIWKVADERGVHHECSVCAHAWLCQD